MFYDYIPHALTYNYLTCNEIHWERVPQWLVRTAASQSVNSAIFMYTPDNNDAVLVNGVQLRGHLLKMNKLQFNENYETEAQSFIKHCTFLYLNTTLG